MYLRVMCWYHLHTPVLCTKQLLRSCTRQDLQVAQNFCVVQVGRALSGAGAVGTYLLIASLTHTLIATQDVQQVVAYRRACARWACGSLRETSAHGLSPRKRTEEAGGQQKELYMTAEPCAPVHHCDNTQVTDTCSERSLEHKGWRGQPARCRTKLLELS